jgi:hypothetical protein
VTLDNAQTISGTGAEVTAALITNAATLSAASNATVTNAINLSDAAAIANVTDITAAFSGGISDSLSNLLTDGSSSSNLNTVTTEDDDVAISISDTLTIAQYDVINAKTTGTLTYTITDSATNINAANSSASKFNGATTLTVNANADNAANTLDLDNATKANLTAVSISGGTGVDRVELSAALSGSNVVTADFVDDSSADKLIFNTHNTNTVWLTYKADGTTAVGSPTAFTFNKISNFDLNSSEDQIGIFYETSNAIGAFREISDTTPAPAYRLRDGVIYEDSFNSDGDILSSAATSAANVRSNVEFIIDTAGSGSADSTGSGDLDFTYILYARSSDTEDADSVQSAYIYAGNYSQQSQTSSDSFDRTALRIVGLAEIVGVTEGDFSSGNFTTTNPLA